MYSSTQKFRSSLFKGLWGAGVKPLLGGLEGKALQHSVDRWKKAVDRRSEKRYNKE